MAFVVAFDEHLVVVIDEHLVAFEVPFEKVAFAAGTVVVNVVASAGKFDATLVCSGMACGVAMKHS